MTDKLFCSFFAEVFEEVLEIVSYMTFFSPTISMDMWSLWPLMMEALADWAIDFFPSMYDKLFISSYWRKEHFFKQPCCMFFFSFPVSVGFFKPFFSKH